MQVCLFSCTYSKVSIKRILEPFLFTVFPHIVSALE
jgi:hypothetical protein